MDMDTYTSESGATWRHLHDDAFTHDDPGEIMCGECECDLLDREYWLLMDGGDTLCDDCFAATVRDETPNIAVYTVGADTVTQDVDDYQPDHVAVSFPDAENGYQTTAQEQAPLGWVNSAHIWLDRADDSVTVTISVGDPRGAIAMSVRRLPDGSLILSVPTPETCHHMRLTADGQGIYTLE